MKSHDVYEFIPSWCISEVSHAYAPLFPIDLLYHGLHKTKEDIIVLILSLNYP